jgi:hypothetical protein
MTAIVPPSSRHDEVAHRFHAFFEVRFEKEHVGGAHMLCIDVEKDFTTGTVNVVE